MLACNAGVFFGRTICSRNRHVETSRREEEMGRVKGSGEGAGREKKKTPSLPLPLSFFRPRTYRKGYYFYSPQSSTVIKSKMAATTILRKRTRFHPPKIRLYCRLLNVGCRSLQIMKTKLKFFSAGIKQNKQLICKKATIATTWKL